MAKKVKSNFYSGFGRIESPVNLDGRTFFIPYNTPSSKNSKIWTGKTLIKSAASRRWINLTSYYWENQSGLFNYLYNLNEKPLHIELTFVRNDIVEFDYVNMSQIVLDSMVKYGWIEDDNANCVLPYFGEYIFNTNSPGVFIRILSKDEYVKSKFSTDLKESLHLEEEYNKRVKKRLNKKKIKK